MPGLTITGYPRQSRSRNLIHEGLSGRFAGRASAAYADLAGTGGSRDASNVP